MKPNRLTTFVAMLLLACANTHAGDDLAPLCADRAAIERVYYEHRTGEKPPFEQVLPAEAIRRLVERDRRCEEALRESYGVEITERQLNAEVKRIETRTRAPEILAELKRALGGDPARFAHTVARPTLVERELRERLENDDVRHAAARRECDSHRQRCLSAKAAGATVQEIVAVLKQSGAGQVTEHAWELAPRSPNPDMPGKEPRAHLDDLPPQFRQVLASQLRQPGDISSVIETPDRFLLFVATSEAAVRLSATSLSIPKLDLETWLNSLHQP